MDLPGFRLHPLKGQMKGFWAVTVRANWRVIFRFAEGLAEDVDYVDYHRQGERPMTMKNPPHPGSVVLRQCVQPLGSSITDAVEALGVTRNTLSELVNGKRGISPEMAVRLAKVFGGTEEGWLVQQAQYELAHVRRDRLKLKRLEIA
jgi:addiction module HigA family antidote